MPKRKRVDPWKGYISPDWVGLEVFQQKAKEALIESNSRAEAKRRLNAALRAYENTIVKATRGRL